VHQDDSGKWVDVTWMPHTTLAQTSHVCLSVRSAHGFENNPRLLDPTEEPDDEWKVRVGAYGIGGLPLVSLASRTPSAVAVPRRTSSLTTGADTSDDAGDSRHRQQQNFQLRPSVSGATVDCIWDFFLPLAVRWRDLPRDSYLRFEILGSSSTGAGGGEEQVLYEGSMPFFSQYGRLATGLQKLELRKPRTDANHDGKDNSGVYPLRPRNERLLNNRSNATYDDGDPIWKACCVLDQLERFEQRARQPGTGASGSTGHASAPTTTRFGQIPSVPWLDGLMKERAQQILATEASKESSEFHRPLILDDEEQLQKAFLIIEFPTFELPIMHEESFYPTPSKGASGGVTPMDLAVYLKQQQRRQRALSDKQGRSGEPGSFGAFDPMQLVPFLDYEDEHDNPVEDKYRALAHDLIRGLVDPALKPDRSQRDRLAAIIDSTSLHPTREEKDLLWRFRFSLVDNRRALTKFLLAVDWTVDSEVVQAAELLEQWRKRSPIEVTDALKLLGKHVAFQTSLVRTYAIDTLQAAPDSELRLYLLQLVQALKYENTEMMSGAVIEASTSGRSSPSSLSTFLINRAAGNIGLANFLYWYLKVELENPSHALYQDVFTAFEAKLSETPYVSSGTDSPSSKSKKAFKSIVDSVSSKIGTPFRDLGHSSSGGERGGEDKSPSAGSSSNTKKKKKPGRRSMWDVLVEQDAFITGVLDIQQRCRDARGKKDVKEEQLRSLLAEEGYDKSPSRDPIPLPTAPEIFINGLHPETAKMFKSALYPAVVDFHIDDTVRTGGGDSSILEHRPSSFKVIVKSGDDLRQDQLVIMMIQLMDGLLKRAALDLCLTPYSILATSPTSGLVEFVDGSAPISQILADHNGSILQFFRKVAPMKGTKYDVRPEVMSTYVRSCAGYCVITYIMAVGDRHLDNIMMTSTGRLFHIDFGFIFGRDPKPLPPAFRLTREMVDGMGGIDSAEYRQFCSLACQAFNALRKSASLILNLLHLMSDAGIEDLSNNPSADAEGVIAKVEERFRLDLTDEQAERYFIGLINDCLAALAPRVMDVFHSFSVARR